MSKEDEKWRSSFPVMGSHLHSSHLLIFTSSQFSYTTFSNEPVLPGRSYAVALIRVPGTEGLTSVTL